MEIMEGDVEMENLRSVPPARLVLNNKTYSKNEIKKKKKILNQAKDRAQITATGAMSCVNIALLKELLGQDPGDNKYYIPTLALLSFCLVLQILAGVISLFISHMRTYYEKHEDSFDNMCCCKVVSKQDKIRNKRYNNVESEEHKTPKSLEAGFRNEDTSSAEAKCCACSCICTTNILEEYEHDILERHDYWKVRHVEIELTGVELISNKRDIEAKMRDSRAKRQQLEQDKSKYKQDEFNRKAREIQDLLEDINKQKEQCEKQEREHEKQEEQRKIINDMAAKIKKNRMLKMATFWQNVLNYIFYIIFIINIFITGFGVSN